jgi:hypothetical protein
LFFVGCALFSSQNAFATASSTESEDVVLLDRPESKLAGIVNTELIPAGAYQTDLTLGHVWYGIDENTNIFTNVFVDLGVLIGSPALSVGAKRRLCSSGSISCSLLVEVGYGLNLGSESSRFFGVLGQNSYSYDIDEHGRVHFGVGGLSYSERGRGSDSQKFEDNFFAWLNFGYDYAFVSEWSIGGGFANALGGLFQRDLGSFLKTSRIAFGASQLFFVRTQYSFGDWVLSGGAALLTMSSGPSLWPVFEIHYRAFE